MQKNCQNFSLGRAKVTDINGKYLIALPIKESLHIRLDEDMFHDAIESLLDVCLELNLKYIRISNTDTLDDLSWDDAVNLLKDKFKNQTVKIILCRNLIDIPDVNIRNTIIKDIHESPMNGHKGIIKTCKRIRQHYFWSNMKKNPKLSIHAKNVKKTNWYEKRLGNL